MIKSNQDSIHKFSNSPCRPWNENHAPANVLAIRLQAIGDLVITLPYLQQLKSSLPPDSRLDLITRTETEEIPKSILLFNKIYAIGGDRNFKMQMLSSLVLLPKLLLKRYDVIIDLQNNAISRFIRKSLRPKAWSEFDRFSPWAAGDRTQAAIESAGLRLNNKRLSFLLKDKDERMGTLKKNGWNGTDELVVLNPAGAFESRNWPVDNYVVFARLWLQQFPNTQFIVMGVNRISAKAGYLKKQLKGNLINLVSLTSASQTFAIMQLAKFVLSEDSGLMHMAWVSGIPTLAMFGSTRSDWARPLGEHSSFLDSSDLDCGSCMKENCKFGDTHCLSRYTPGFVFEKAVALLGKIQNQFGI